MATISIDLIVMDILNESLHRLAEPALDRLAERGPSAKKVINHVAYDNEGHVNMYSFTHTDYRSIILTEIDTMLGTPELLAQLVAVADAVEADQQARELLPMEFRGSSATFEKTSWIATYIVAPFLLHLCENFGGLWYKDSWFEMTYEAFRTYLVAEAVSVVLIAPLNNFSATFER